MLSVQLVPIIKSKSGLISSKDNYRQIAIASVLSKVLELIILERIDMFVYTHENQFGFKKQHSTDTSGVSRGVFWLPGNPPSPAMIFLKLEGLHPYMHRPSPAT